MRKEHKNAMLNSNADEKTEEKYQEHSKNVMADIEKKYKKHQEYLKFALERARYEEKIHEAQKGSKKYQNRHDEYMRFDPIINFKDAKFSWESKDDFKKSRPC